MKVTVTVPEGTWVRTQLARPSEDGEYWVKRAYGEQEESAMSFTVEHGWNTSPKHTQSAIGDDSILAWFCMPKYDPEKAL